MTEAERKYNTLLQEIAGLIESKNTEISVLKWRIKELEEKLKEAEEAEKNESERMGA